MLVLSRKSEEAIHIGDDVVIRVVSIRGDKVRLGIEAPREMEILREELTPDAKARAERVQRVREQLAANETLPVLGEALFE